MDLKLLQSAKARRDEIKKVLNVDLSNVGSSSLDEEKINSHNCENYIGVSQIPMGVAGPVDFQSQKFDKNSVYVPIATNEGALVASISRGAKALRHGNNFISVTSERIGVTRGPVYEVKSMKQGLELKEFFDKEFSNLKKIAEATSSHLTLLKVEPQIAGRYLYARYYFDTEEAMGLNMITIATEKINEEIYSRLGIKCLAISGNFCVDKKSSYQNFLKGRGTSVWAESVISSESIKQILKSDSQRMHKVWISKCMMGTILSGSIGANLHAANIIAGIFLATGQDAGHIVESSMCVTYVEPFENGDLFVSCYLPALIVGTVGGGTGLGTAKEALQIMGLNKNLKEKESILLAEIIASTVLAGEISLLASLTESSLVLAHKKLGRGEK